MLKKHYKLYKSGKQWCCMALTAFAVMTAGMALHQTVQADTTNTSVPTEQISTLNQAQDDESTASEKQDTSVDQVLDVSQASDIVRTPAESTANAVDTTVPATKNGWYDENGQKVYYQNGQTKSGQDYAYLESMTNPQEKNWYMVKDGVALSGLQKWFGTYYYFDPVTYLKVTDTEVPVKWANGAVTPYRFDQTGALVQGLYTDSAGHQYYSDPNTYLVVKNQRVDLPDGSSMILGQDGQALKGLQHFNGALYYLDPATGRMVKHDYRTFNNDIHGYLFGENGQAQTGLQEWFGTYYYFDPETYQLVTDQYLPVHWANGDVTWYRFGKTGLIYTGLYRDGQAVYYFDPSTYVTVKNDFRVAEDGQGYMLGSDGKAISGLQKWFGTYYYFDPATYQMVRNQYLPVTWSNCDVTWYRFGNTGAIYTGLYRDGQAVYYFDPSTYLMVKNDFRVAEDGNGYMFGNDGKAISGLQKWFGTYYYFDPTTYQMVRNNYIPVHWDNGDTTWYMFDNTGAIVTGLYKWYGSWYYFSPNTYEIVKNAKVTISNADYYLSNSGAVEDVVNNANAISQLPQLPTGCEMTAVTMMLQYAGYNVTKEQIANETPRSNNPWYGFVGNPYSNYGTGLWVAPNGIAPVVNRYVGHSSIMTGNSIESIKDKLVQRHLVVVWQAHMHGFGTHAITLTGFDNNGFFYNDPWTGQKNAYMTFGTFNWNWRDAPASRGAISY